MLAEDGESAWLLTPRQRLDNRVVRVALDAIAHWQASSDFVRALDVGARTFAVVPMSSRLAERLMRLELEAGAVHDALDVHRRHLDALGTGIRTSATLRQFYEAALTMQTAQSTRR